MRSEGTFTVNRGDGYGEQGVGMTGREEGQVEEEKVKEETSIK